MKIRKGNTFVALFYGCIRRGVLHTPVKWVKKTNTLKKTRTSFPRTSTGSVT